MFINYYDYNDHVALSTPSHSSYSHLTHSGGSALHQTLGLTLRVDLEHCRSLFFFF